MAIIQPNTKYEPEKSVTGGQAQAMTSVKEPPTPEAIKSTSKQFGVAEFEKHGVTKPPPPPETKFSPYEALRSRTPGGPAVSPYVPIEKETPPPVTVPPDTTGAKVTEEADTGMTDLNKAFDQWKQDHGDIFDMAEDLKDEKIQSYEDLYDRQLARFSELEGIMEDVTAQKNQLVKSGEAVQRQILEDAYSSNQETLRIAQERLLETQKKILAEREKQLERKKINEENMLAVIGGFGSMAGNKMLLDSIEEAEDKMAYLKVEFNLEDQEMAQKVVDLNNEFKNDKLKLEQWKQEQITKNYSELQSYIADIIKDEGMADADKVEAINSAKDQYNSTVSSLNKDIIDARFELSKEIVARSDALRKEMEEKSRYTAEQARQSIEDAQSDLALLAEGMANTDVSEWTQETKDKVAELEKASNMPPGFTEAVIETLKMKAQDAGSTNTQVMSQVDNQGNWTIVAVDKATGQVVATSTLKGAGKTISTTATNDEEKLFGIGGVGGWCGDYASRISTGSRLGNSWAGKIDKVTHMDNPKPGDKCVIPLGVTDSSTDPGHVFVVIDYNPETRAIKALESNKDGRQSRGEGQGVITLGEYNQNDLNIQYGDNWGYIEGELKGDIQKAAIKLGYIESEAGDEEVKDLEKQIAERKAQQDQPKKSIFERIFGGKEEPEESAEEPEEPEDNEAMKALMEQIEQRKKKLGITK